MADGGAVPAPVHSAVQRGVLVGANVTALLQLHEATLHGAGADAQHGRKAGLAGSAPVPVVGDDQQRVEHAVGGGSKIGVGLGTGAQLGVERMTVVDWCVLLGGTGNICLRGLVIWWHGALVGVRFVASARWLGWAAGVEPV